MTFTRHRLVLVTTAGLVGCGSIAVPIATSRTPSGPAASAVVAPARLLVQQGNPPDWNIELVDAISGRGVLSLTSGVMTPDSKRLYAVIAHGSAAGALREIDTSTGSTVASTSVPYGFDLPISGIASSPTGLSPDGGHLALVAGTMGAGGTLTSTRLLVFETAHLSHTPTAVSLRGDFSFDGLSNDGQNLFLLENLGAAVGAGYHVRRYDLAAGRLDPNVVVDKATGERLISGQAIDRTFSADGGWQFTVYAFGSGAPFVHALKLDSSDIAACIDLTPAPTDQELEFMWTVVASHDGSHVYAVNSGDGFVVEMQADNPWQTRHATLSLASATSREVRLPWQAVTVEAKRILFGGAVMAPDDRSIYAVGDHGVVVIDTAALRVRGALMSGQVLAALSLGADGHHLYAVSSDTGLLMQIDLPGGAWIAIGGAVQPVRVISAVP